MPANPLSAAMPELLSVVAAAALVWLAVVVQHVANVALRGSDYVTGDRSVAPAMTGFYGRATRTLMNSVESALMYAPAALVVVIAGKANLVSHIAAPVYVVARVIFAVSYWLNIPKLRSFGWFAGMVCCVAIYATAIV